MCATKNAVPKDQEQKKKQVNVESASFRELPGLLGLLQRSLLCLVPILGILFIMGIHTYWGWGLYTEQYVGLFITLVFVTMFFSKPASNKAPHDYLPWYDALLAILALPIGLYLTWFYPQIAFCLGDISLERTILGVLTILLILEGVRRFAGWVFVIVIGAFILYGRYADLFPGSLQGIGTTWERLITYLYIDPNSILGQMTLAAGIALAFILFGNVLTVFGGANHLANLSIAILGHLRGGSAKAAVGMSSLIGSVTGGCTTNAMITGTITIPLMTKAGYKPEYAGAVEAVSSSGGGIMPPVMGIVAFMIAENLGMPYADVALAALIPALLFYVALFVQVDLEAGKRGFLCIPKAEISKSRAALRDGWVIIPCLAILIYTLMIIRINPNVAGVISGFASVPILMMTKDGRGNFIKRAVATLEGTGKMLMTITALIAGAGIIIGIASASGLGFNIAYALTIISNDNLFFLLVIAAVASVVLGMGMPPVPAYALVGTLIAPAMIELGVLPIAAHLFIFYFATVANWTPPVALACFATSALTGANPNQIGLISMRLGILAYVIPFLFVYSPALILNDASLTIILLSVVTAVIGTITLGIGLVGYLFHVVPLFRRVLYCIASVALLIPFNHDIKIGTIVNGTGFLVVVILLLWEIWYRRSVTGSLHKGISFVNRDYSA